MTTPLSTALTALDAFCQQNKNATPLTFHRGVEREALRVKKSDGRISHLPHPKKLGSALTHSSITTDYSESLMEFITGVHPNVEGVMSELNTIHHFVNHTLAEQDECLWPASMPCYLESNADVPIADYGTSNVGKLKKVYREGLSNRYGRIMQCIAGMHYNFSFDKDFWTFLQSYKTGSVNSNTLQDFKSDSYFALIRNFRRNSWLLSYLFGASPAVDKSFFQKGTDRLSTLAEHTYFGENATSLRMSDLGYQNNAQADLFVCYNEVSTYIQTLKKALKTPYPKYQQIGLKVDGHYQQLNTNILQIENEYYSDIRPKRVTESGEHPSTALQSRGVEYIEVRIMDIDPFSSIGMSKNTLYFMDVFLVFCMLDSDNPLLEEECHALRELQQEIATHGRDESYLFDFGNGNVSLKDQGLTLLEKLQQVAQFLSQQTGNENYIKAIEVEMQTFNETSSLPSNKLLSLAEGAGSYTDAMLELAKKQQKQWLSIPVSKEESDLFAQQAKASLEKQDAIEAADTLDFDTYLTEYLTPQ
ncbi:glutamate--cysteine ligase [Marinomonas sp. 15G1-11]|uniref:Glutamate--cysteine ligase n=1 Tax=Marinomonas phaeophyticola TaxID=3004091 RepID=A0ABT4JZN6_9GAMM|nr:glutamate--cysteine ligase [Marinomonas sp. 15G1-11]MCZ2723572.1 glutamate--cysteine ligase [Marinomonas sp. 15G1-11]